MNPKHSFPVLTRVMLVALFGCCAVFAACGLFPEHFALERPELTDLSEQHQADAANEGKLVFACERMQEPLTLTDEAFGFRCKGLKLTRRVLTYQGDKRGWEPTTFNEPEAQPTPVLNGLPLDAALVTAQGEAELVSLENYRIPAELAESSSIVGGNTLYVRWRADSDPQQPEPGDMMIQWLVHPMPAVLSVIATQRNGRLVCAEKPTGYPDEVFELQATDRSFNVADAELNKRGDAKERAAMGCISLLFFILVYCLRADMARGFTLLCGGAGEAPKPGCLVTLAAAVALMVISYQAGRLFTAPETAWPYVVLPAAAGFALIRLQRNRNSRRAELPPAEPPHPTEPDVTDDATDIAEPPSLPQRQEEATPVAVPPLPHAPTPRRQRRGCATVAGLTLLALGGTILVWGERYNAELSRHLDEVGRRVLTLDAASAPRPETEGEPVCVSGVVETPEVLHDQAFGVEQHAVRLIRHAAVRQWTEEVYQREVRRRRRHNSDDDTYLRYEYSYDLIWSPEYIDSDRFHIRKGHENSRPLAPELTARTFLASQVALGAYTLSEAVVAQLEGDEELPLAEDYRPLPNVAPYHPRRTDNGHLELLRTPASSPVVPAANGDRRFRWSYLPSGRTFTVLGAQQGGSLVPWDAASQEPLLLVRSGTWTAEEMLTTAEEDRFYTALGMRVCYIAMLLGGLFLLFRHKLTYRLA